MPVWRRILEAIDRRGGAAMVTVAATRGSAPREAGARMIVNRDGTFSGTIGGGTLEWRAIALAQAALERKRRGREAAVLARARTRPVLRRAGRPGDRGVRRDRPRRSSRTSPPGKRRRRSRSSGASASAAVSNGSIGDRRSPHPGSAALVDGVLVEGFGDESRQRSAFRRRACRQGAGSGAGARCPSPYPGSIRGPTPFRLCAGQRDTQPAWTIRPERWPRLRRGPSSSS